MNATNIPLPPKEEDAARWEHSRLRRRMLSGKWKPDLEAWLGRAIPHIRREAWGTPDITANVFATSCAAIATLYGRECTVSHTDAVSAATISDLIKDAGLWPMMQTVQRDTIGMREMLVHVNVVDGPTGPKVVYRPVPPDMVVAEATGAQPDRPVRLRELDCLPNPQTGESVWVWLSYDISDPANPIYQVLEATKEATDLSEAFLKAPGGLKGEAYPFRTREGRAVIPYVIYRAALTGQMWDAYRGAEWVEGSLHAGVLWTYYHHASLNASFPQRVIINGYVAADSVGEGSEQRQYIVADPVGLLVVNQHPDSQHAPSIAQWQPGADPMALIESISIYERRVAAFAGISPSDIQRVSGDPRSGYAIAVTHSAQRESQRRFEPIFRPVDQELLALTAILWNRHTGGTLAEEGYRVAYEALPLSPEEKQADREHLAGLLAMGLIDRVTAYEELHPGISREDAEAKLLEIAAINARYRAI